MIANHPETSSTRSSEAIIFTAVLLSITLVLLSSTFSLRASSATVPRLVGIPLALLLCYRLIRELAARPRGRNSDGHEQPRPRPGETSAILWFLALPAASTIFGFVAGPALYVFAWARYRADERVAVAVAAAVSTAGAILILFVRLLGSPLWQGLLGDLL